MSNYRSRRSDIRSNYVTAYFYKDKKFLYSRALLQNIQIPASTTQSVLDVSENGEVAFWEITMDSHTAVPFVTLYGDDESSESLCDQSIDDLVTQGRGLTPGAVKLVGGISPDTPGQIMYNVAYAARYKADSNIDAVGKSTPTFIIRWFGQLPIPYRRFTMVVQNPSSTTALNISSFYLMRTIYEQIPAQPVAPNKSLERTAETDALPGPEPGTQFAPKQEEEWLVGGYRPK